MCWFRRFYDLLPLGFVVLQEPACNPSFFLSQSIFDPRPLSFWLQEVDFPTFVQPINDLSLWAWRGTQCDAVPTDEPGLRCLAGT